MSSESHVKIWSHIPLPRPIVKAFKHSNMSGESVWPLVRRDDNQLMPRLEKENEERNNLKWNSSDRKKHGMIFFLLKNKTITSTRVARFYFEPFSRICYFRIESFSNNCHCLERQSLLHRLTLELCGTFHLSGKKYKQNNHFQYRHPCECSWHLCKWCLRHHNASRSFVAPQSFVPHFSHFNHFGCFSGHHHQIASGLRFHLA